MMERNKGKNILAVILCIASAVFYVKVPYKSEKIKLDGIKSDLQLSELKYDIYNKNINGYDDKENDIKVLNSAIEDKTSRLYPYINQEKILVELNSLISDSGLKADLSFESEKAGSNSSLAGSDDSSSSYDKLKVIADTYKSLNGQDVDDVKSSDSIAVTMNFSGKYEDFEKFLQAVYNYKKDIIISQLKVSGASGDISGSMMLNMFAVPKLTYEDADYDEWNYENSYGKDNPFDSSNTSYEISPSDTDLIKNYNFVMAVKPVSSDLPVLTIGKAQNDSKDTYIYENSNEDENAEITLDKRENKYFYKYKTDNMSYPKDYSGSGIEFEPYGNGIIIRILSSSRENDNDNTGLNLTVNNNTDKYVKVIIQDDDKTNPKVKIKGNGSKVEIVKR